VGDLGSLSRGCLLLHESKVELKLVRILSRKRFTTGSDNSTNRCGNTASNATSWRKDTLKVPREGLWIH
jgi:hypothetical protein